MQDLKAGALLVAQPNLDHDPAFAKSVIVLIEHNGPKGLTIGVNIASIPIEGRIHSGGPMNAPVAFIIHDAKVPGHSQTRPLGDTGYAVTGVWHEIGPIDQTSLIESVRTRLSALETCVVMIGYAGWGKGDLEEELASGWWLPTAVSLDTLLKTPPHERWDVAARSTVSVSA